MPKLLVVTNDFPPTIGGIQSYVRDFLAQLPAEDIVVFASTQDAQAARAWDAHAGYQVVRYPHRIMLPSPDVAAQMKKLVAEHNIDTVWFPSAAPLALLAHSLTGVRVVASTHGHEVGWSMFPGGRSVLRSIGTRCDAVTYISDYTLGRLQRPFGAAAMWVHLPSGVDASAYRRPPARPRQAYGLHDGPVVLCIARLVPRKGQDQLLKVWPRILQRFPDAQLVIVGEGSYEKRLRELADGLAGVVFTGRVTDEARTDLLLLSDIFAMPARTRGKGLDVEGLGIVYLEAQAAGLPVIAGDSGGAPETVTPDTGLVVSGRSSDALEAALVKLLANPSLREKLGRAGRNYVSEQWTWEQLGTEFRRTLFT
ncbi:glycosyltransferase family 4 protein [Corynebacterium sp. H130]|uniref:glycosyltransferase family 4 protein n=1 Tax=Corynebacterium sp. H130 TaxID=3133444 RepID=UPI0030A7A188